MKRLDVYKHYAERLIQEKKAYRCYCTKEQLDAQREALKKKDLKAQFKYLGTCRHRADEPNSPFVVRFKVGRSGSITYVDKVFGEVVTPNIELQDFVILRSDGVPLYNFGAVVDDITMGISLVARGRDHMINTPSQILLYQAFGRSVPEFAHLPMMLAPSGEKLSKRHGAVSVGEYKEQGYAPSAVLNYLARFGWSFGDTEIFSKEELIAAFDWTHCGRGDGKFDPKKFLAINHEHLKSPRLMPDAEYADRVLRFVHARGGLDHVTTADVIRALYTIRDRAQTFVQAADMLDPFFRRPPVMDEKASAKFLVKHVAKKLRELREALATIDDFTEASAEAKMHAWLADAGLEIKAIGQPVRVALTGRTASPSLYQVMFVLGRDETCDRLARAAEIAEKSTT
jgi:glutamyl-tRNA synthetase